MFFLLVRRRVKGVAIPTGHLGQIQPLRADVHIGDHHSQALGRIATQAWVHNPAPGPDIIPRLLDARVTGMAQCGMNITGMEEIDGVLYAQSWWCRTQ
ncbi:hypothetical protein ACQKO7_21085 [Pseudomonas putida]|uniref:hypothetical protein n=1 Tax=Pseudomonas TaxID=286 RepID=UPI0021BB7810|nr:MULTISPECIES: hypothetical protein [unclassified Pseudomonas]MCT8166449.1 hypothetical protein [Pseudomonas sp. HD6422]MCT8185294.1 hypothetical protein [Pseudomonas sp. HD6421]